MLETLDLSETKKKIVLAWDGLPNYAAHLIQAARLQIDDLFPVIGTVPDVPTKGMEDILGKKITWLKAGRKYSWREIDLEVPDIFFHSGWRYPHFISLADEVRHKGGVAVGIFDNPLKSSFRQLIGRFYFRLFMRKKYFAALVPGKSGYRLARRLGFNASRVFTGMLGSSPAIFSVKIPINKRSKQILFVGNFNINKAVLELVEAFNRVTPLFPDWSLLLVGSGELRNAIPLSDQIKVQDFQPPKKIAKLLNDSRVFALASHSEHWGLVVHEATLSGCALLLNANIGAVPDLASRKNAFLFQPTNVDKIEQGLLSILSWDEAKLHQASIESQSLASHFSPKVFGRSFKKILDAIENDA